MNQYHEDGHSICAFLRLNYYLEKTNADLYTDINKLTIDLYQTVIHFIQFVIFGAPSVI